LFLPLLNNTNIENFKRSKNSSKCMVFRLPKRLENTVLGIASALIIAGAPLYTKTAESQNNLPKENSVRLFSFDRYYPKTYDVILEKNSKKKVSFMAKRTKNPASLEIIFGAEEPETLYGNKVDAINTMPIDPGFSRFVVLYPRKARINQIEQEAYVLPEKKFINLVSLENSPIKKTILESGEDVIDSVTSFFPGINPLKSIKNRVIESNLTKEEKEYSAKAKKLEEKLGEEYTFEKIEFFQQKGLREKIENKRKIKISFDTKDLEGTVLVQAMLKPAIGNSSTPLRGSGDWINTYFLLQGEKLPFWIKKQEMLAKETISYNDVQEILKKRKTNDMGAYDPAQKRFIIYNFDEGEIGNFGTSEKSSIRWLSLFLSVEKDIKREKFSDEGIILLKEKDSIKKTSMPSFYKACREAEQK